MREPLPSANSAARAAGRDAQSAPRKPAATAVHAGGPSSEASNHSESMVVADPASQALVKLLARIAPSDVPAMINGESGTGKALVARHIHRASGREGAFLAVNCSAIADRLAAGEPLALEGASPSASSLRPERWLEAARGGTIFLDEVADLPPSLQNQLLRVLQEYEGILAGSHEPAPCEVRLIAATSVDLGEAVSAGHFRLDLFYRLNTAQVRLLPLRQRRGDIAALARHFLYTYARRLKLQPPVLAPDALAALTDYPWPGNVRELENVIRFALLVAPGQELRAEHLKLSHTRQDAQKAVPVPDDSDAPPAQRLSNLLTLFFQAPGARLFDDLEGQVVVEAFRFAGQNQVRAAALLGITRNVLRTLLKKHGLLRR